MAIDDLIKKGASFLNGNGNKNGASEASSEKINYEKVSERLESYLERIFVSPVTKLMLLDKEQQKKEKKTYAFDPEYYKENSLSFITRFGILPYAYDETTKKLLVLVDREFNFREKITKTIGLIDNEEEHELAAEDSEQYLESLEAIFIDRLHEYIPQFFDGLMPQILKEKIKSPRDIIFDYVDKSFFDEVSEYVYCSKSVERYFDGKNAANIADEGIIVKDDEKKLRDALNKIMIYATQRHASDIHIEYANKDHGLKLKDAKGDKVRFKARIRVDGILQDYPYTIPQDKYEGMINVICQDCTTPLDITNKFTPQDGRMEWRSSFYDTAKEINSYEIRVSLIPEADGHRCAVLRIQQKGHLKKIDELGLSEDVLDGLQKIAKEPYGLVLVTGPTGSGKTTTLYAMLNTINDPHTKIITAEEPVEIKINGIEQIGINDAVGMTFPKLLRSVLRHDPDKILIGEIRDAETAQIAIDAANTGHLVLSTLHTNDAPSAIRRLANLKGIDTGAFAEALKAVMGQRLMNTFSVPFYSKFMEVHNGYFHSLQMYNDALHGNDKDGILAGLTEEFKSADLKYKQFLEQRGVEMVDAAIELNKLFGKALLPENTYYLPKSPHENFQGRTAITEFWRVGRKAKDLIFNSNLAENELRKAAIELDGMKPMVVSGMQKVLEYKTSLDKLVYYVGETTFEENRDIIMKYCFPGECK